MPEVGLELVEEVVGPLIGDSSPQEGCASAFKGVVTSFTNDILMPPIGLLLGGVDFADLSVTIQEAAGEAAAVTLNYGVFINTVIDFLIVAFAIFMVVKAMNSAMKEEEGAPAPPPGPSTEEVLLTEIRDVLRSR